MYGYACDWSHSCCGHHVAVNLAHRGHVRSYKNQSFQSVDPFLLSFVGGNSAAISHLTDAVSHIAPHQRLQ